MHPQGYRKITPVPSPSDFIATNLKYMLDETDPERGYVHFGPGDDVILMVSNFGGMSPLELGALTDELLLQLETDYKISPVRVYQGPIETSLNAPAFSTSILNLNVAAKNCPFTVAQMKDFLDVKTTTSWESMAGAQSSQKPRKDQFIPAAKQEVPRTVDPGRDLKGTYSSRTPASNPHAAS